MRVGTRVAALVVVTLLVGTGCSWRQTQAWFGVRGATVTEAEARDIADKVNVNEPAGCDVYYIGACVPSNVTDVSCFGTPGGGTKVRGPFNVDRWDHHGLDPDRNGIACDVNGPIGSLDNVSSIGTSIQVSGWAVDLDTTRPVNVNIYVDGLLARSTIANNGRFDVDAVTGLGMYVGFATSVPAGPGRHEVCVVALDGQMLPGMGAKAPDTSFGCRSVTIGSFEDGFIQQVNASRALSERGPILVCPALTRSAQRVAAERLAGTAPATWSLFPEENFGAGGATATDIAASNGFGGPAAMLHQTFPFDWEFSVYTPIIRLYLDSLIILNNDDKAIGVAAASSWVPGADVAFAIVWGTESDCV